MPLSARRFGGADKQQFDPAGREESRGECACAENERAVKESAAGLTGDLCWCG